MARVSQPERVLIATETAAPGARWLRAARTPLTLLLVLGLAASISLSQATLVLLAVWLGLARRAGVVPRLRLPLVLPLAIFAAWSVVAALVSAQPSDSLGACKNLINLAAFWIVASTLEDAAAARRFFTGLAVALAVVAALSVVQVTACPATPPSSRPLAHFFRHCRRAHGFFSIYMTLAGALAMMLSAMLPRLFRRESAVAAAPLWIVSVAALALTYVRGAWVGLVGGMLMVLAGLRRRSVVAIGLVVIVLAALVALPHVRERVQTIGDLNDDTTRDRLAMLHAGLSLVRQHPLTGIGPGQVKRVYPAVATPDALRRSTSHLHDTPLQIAVERGIPGLLAWLAIFASFLLHTFRFLSRLPEDGEDRALIVGVQGAIVTFLVAGLFEYNFGDTEVVLIAAALMALPFVVADTATPPASTEA